MIKGPAAQHYPFTSLHPFPITITNARTVSVNVQSFCQSLMPLNLWTNHSVQFENASKLYYFFKKKKQTSLSVPSQMITFTH